MEDLDAEAPKSRDALVSPLGFTSLAKSEVLQTTVVMSMTWRRTSSIEGARGARL